MKAETADYMAKARAGLSDAQQIATLPCCMLLPAKRILQCFTLPMLIFSSRPARYPRRMAACGASLRSWQKRCPRGRTLSAFYSPDP
jgi:hypothetical protein